jgi:[ribosomal protein S5]-alanine N-acetyltransferase
LLLLFQNETFQILSRHKIFRRTVLWSFKGKIMELIPIQKKVEDNEGFISHPDCRETIFMSIDFYNKVGYHPPWIGYFVKYNDQFVGSVGFKGAPNRGRVEIAYGTFERFRQKGLGTKMCKALVELSLKTDPSIIITARTLPEKNHSTRILEINDFELLGTVIDEEDGEVWEWKYKNAQAHNKT